MAAIADRHREDKVDVTLFSSVLPSALGSTLFGVIAIRVDPDVLATLRKEARRRRVGYQTLINEALAEHVRRHVAVTFATVRCSGRCRIDVRR